MPILLRGLVFVAAALLAAGCDTGVVLRPPIVTADPTPTPVPTATPTPTAAPAS